MKIMGNDVLWVSKDKNVAIAYSRFDKENKYKIYIVFPGQVDYVCIGGFDLEGQIRLKGGNDENHGK